MASSLRHICRASARLPGWTQTSLAETQTPPSAECIAAFQGRAPVVATSALHGARAFSQSPSTAAGVAKSAQPDQAGDTAEKDTEAATRQVEKEIEGEAAEGKDGITPPDPAKTARAEELEGEDEPSGGHHGS